MNDAVSNQTLEGRGICVGFGSESVKRGKVGTGIICESHNLHVKRSPHKPLKPSNKKTNYNISAFIFQICKQKADDTKIEQTI